MAGFWLRMLVVLVSTLAAHVSLAEVRVEHAQGVAVLPETPRKVLVFDLATLDTMEAIGVEPTGVPGSNIPDYLAKYRDNRFLKVGSLHEPDLEAVAAAEPDLIIVAMRSSPAFATLSRIAPTIDLTIAPNEFLAGSRRNAETLGQIFGTQDAVRDRLAKLDTAIGRVRSAATEAGTALAIMTSGGKVTAYGPGSRFGWLHDDLGLTPAAERVEAAVHGEVISFEFLAKTDPDWLFVVDRDAAIGSAGTAATATLDNALVASTKAARAGRIVHVDTVRWYLVGGGLDAMRVVADQIADALSGGE